MRRGERIARLSTRWRGGAWSTTPSLLRFAPATEAPVTLSGSGDRCQKHKCGLYLPTSKSCSECGGEVIFLAWLPVLYKLLHQSRVRSFLGEIRINEYSINKKQGVVKIIRKEQFCIKNWGPYTLCSFRVRFTQVG